MQANRSLFVRLFLINIILFLTGCANQDPRSAASTFTKKTGLISEDFGADGLTLRSWQRISPPVTVLRVYVEGDGFAWKSRTQPSDDPTPHNPVGLKLAAADPSANVLYLARPCQYIGPPLPATCTASVWTDRRFSPQIIDAMDNVLSQMMQRYPQARIELVGYSGGGNIAALLAARRHDVVSLRTVAGNLDVAWGNSLHHVSAMPGALSAIDSAKDLNNIPQLHFSGSKDTIVPPSVAERFQQAVGTRCAQVEIVPEMDHGSDWAAIWPGLLAQKVGCGE